MSATDGDALWCRMLYNGAHGDCREIRAAKRFASDEGGKAREGAGQNREDKCQPGAGGLDCGWPGVQRIRKGTVLCPREPTEQVRRTHGTRNTEKRTVANHLRCLMPKIQW